MQGKVKSAVQLKALHQMKLRRYQKKILAAFPLLVQSDFYYITLKRA